MQHAAGALPEVSRIVPIGDCIQLVRRARRGTIWREVIRLKQRAGLRDAVLNSRQGP